MNRVRARRDTEIRAEAAAWLARVRSDAASEADIANFWVWLGEDVRHRQAFDAVNAVWESVGGAPDMREILGGGRAERDSRSAIGRRSLLVGGGVAAVAAGVWTLRDRKPALETYSSQIGEQRRVALADGSLAILDTDSRIDLDFGARSRTVHHVAGRVYFDVAHDPEYPFVVDTGDRQIVALGTAFDVERSQNTVAVVLITGQIAISPLGAAMREAPVELHSPGDHVVFSGPQIMRDNIDLDVATAWQSGRAIFNGDSLGDAVAQMNRYSRRPIVLIGEKVSGLRISGTYSTGDSEAFATSLSTLLPVTVTLEPARIMLAAK